MINIYGIKTGLKIFLGDIIIVYKRPIKKEDIKQLDVDEELIYYYNDNVAYTIVYHNNNYIYRKKKIFNNQITEEETVKTPEQLIKKIMG